MESALPILVNSREFIRNEFANVKLGDKRLNHRLLKVAETVNDGPSFSIPSMTNAERSQLKGIYRFFQNPKVSEEKILQTHYVNTVERMEAYAGKILLINDSCFVSPAKGMSGLLTRGRGKENCVRTHYCLASSEDGKQLFGILDFNILSDPISQKHPELRDESDIWIKTAENCLNHIRGAGIGNTDKLLSRCLFVADRETDEFELMTFLLKNNLGFIIRSQYDRNVEFRGKKSKVKQLLKKTKKHGVPYKVKTRKNKEICEVTVQRSILREITVIAPTTCKGLAAMVLNMAVVKEKSRKKDAIEWRLWTTEEIDNASSSEFTVTSYSHRWKIEEVNKAAKVGVRVEERQFTEIEHFNPFLAMAFVVAWRMVALRTIAEVSPKAKVGKAFEEDEVLYLKAEAKGKGLKMSLVGDALHLIARLGGFTRSYARPGWQILWQGWIKFYERVEGFKLAKKIYSK